MVWLGAVVLLRTSILRDAGIGFSIWGIAALTALFLAKFMHSGAVCRVRVPCGCLARERRRGYSLWTAPDRFLTKTKGQRPDYLLPIHPECLLTGA